MGSYSTNEGPNPMTGFLIRKENRDKDTQGEDSHLTTGTDRSHVSKSQGTPRTASNHQKLEERYETDSSSGLPRGN